MFRQIKHHFLEMNVDLFTCRLMFQLPRYFSWRVDPTAEAMDAFQQSWKAPVRRFANPSWNLVGKVLSTVEKQEAEVVVVTPIWLSQPWYPKLPSLLSFVPLRIHPYENFIGAGVEGRESS